MKKRAHGRYYPTPPHPTPPTSTKHHGRLKVVQLNGNWSTKWRWNPTYKMHKMIQNVDQHISYTFIYQMCFISPIFLCLKPTLHLYFDPPRCAPSSSKAAASASASVCPMMERERSERPQPVGTGGTTFDYLQQQLGTDFFWRSDAILIYWICYVHMYSIYIYTIVF